LGYYSPLVHEEFLDVTRDRVQLTAHPLIGGSETVWAVVLRDGVPDTVRYTSGLHYRLDTRTGIFIPLSFPDSLYKVTIRYAALPSDIPGRFAYFDPDSVRHAGNGQLTPRRPWDPLEKSKLTITGSKSVTLTLAPDEGVSIDQALYLKADGELAPNMLLQAQISDTQSQMTPEGDSRELSSIDQMYIRLYGEPYEIAFGDLDFPITGTEFMDINPKFEGLRAGWFANPDARAAIAVSKSRSLTLEIDGTDGVQGPYYLRESGTTGNLQIVAGTEEIYLNGARMNRGDDYTIDYDEGTITFTIAHAIDANSVIRATFQYTDEAYRKTLYLADTGYKLSDRLSLCTRLMVQNDDRENPLETTLTDDDLAILSEAGDHTAYGNGVTETNIGEGSYILSEDGGHYIYVGPDSTGIYNLSFTYMGDGKGTYNRISPSQYEWVGTDPDTGTPLGDYEPVKTLPLPEFKANYDLALTGKDTAYDWKIEGIAGDYDKNTQSDRDDSDNDSYALHTGFALHPDYDLVKPEIDFSLRHISENLFTFAEISDASDDYNNYAFTVNDSVGRRDIATSAKLTVADLVVPEYAYRSIRYYGFADYYSNLYGISTREKSWLPYLNYNYRDSKQKSVDAENEQTLLRQAEGGYTLAFLRLAGYWRNRQYTDRPADSFSTGTELQSQQGSLSTVNRKAFTGKLSFTEEHNRTMTADLWQRSRDSYTWRGEQLFQSSRHMVRGTYSRQIIRQPNTSESTYDLAEIAERSEALQNAVRFYANYSLSNVEYVPKIRELQYVGDGLGDYDSTGTYVEDGDFDYEYINGDDTEKTVEVNADATLNLAPRILWTKTPVLSRLETETNVVASENSREADKWRVYFLRPDALMDNFTTIYGKLTWRQTAWYDLIPKRVTMRLETRRENTLDQRYQDRETADTREYEVAFTLYNIRSNDFEFTADRTRERESTYDSDVRTDALSLEARTRYGRAAIFQTTGSYSFEDGNKQDAGDDYRIRSAGLTETTTLFVKKSLRIVGKVKVRNNRRTGSKFLTSLAEKRNGWNEQWSMSLNYRLNPNTQASLEYSGDSYPQQKANHKLTMEVRAEF
jgi:hypothetical protein